MSIYTRTGDKGETGLFGGGRVSKNHPRVSAYGSLDELNCHLGAARSHLPDEVAFKDFDQALAQVQNECFVIGTLLATPADKLASLQPPFSRGLPTQSPSRLEQEIDSWDKLLPALTNFILPGGSACGAQLHIARAVARRAEREAVALADAEQLPQGIIVYLNRLSTWLFVAARWINHKQGRTETVWTGLPKSQ